MTTDELKTFICLAHIKNFNKVAATLFISQSTVSARIKNLENELGGQLFVRSASGLSLTPAGQQFYHYALNIDNLFQEAQGLLNFRKYKQQIIIAAPDSHWTRAVIPALKDFLNFGETSFRFYSEHSLVVNQLILDNKIDFGITLQHIKHQNIICEYIYDYPFHLVSHPDLLSSCEAMKTMDLEKWPLIRLDRGNQFDEWVRRNVITCNYFIEVESMSTYIYLLLNKIGCGFLSERIAKPYFEQEELISHSYLNFESTPREVAYLIYNKEKEKNITPYINKIKEYAKNSSGNQTHLAGVTRGLREGENCAAHALVED